MEQSVTLFLDIDGVFNISHPDIQAIRLDRTIIWPIPSTIPLLQAIEQNAYVLPVWMSHWGSGSCVWNDYAGTPHWPVGFPLSPLEEMKMGYFYPALTGKVLAVQCFIRSHPGRRSIWVEDGFPTVPLDWARQNNITLVDTTKEPLRTMLLSRQVDVSTILAMFLQEVRV